MLKFNSGQIILIVIAIFICENYLAFAGILDNLDNEELLNWDRELSSRELHFHSEFDICNDGIEKYVCGNESSDYKLLPVRKNYFGLKLEDFADQVLSHIDENDENVTKSEKILKKFVQAHFNKDYEEQVKTLEIANSFGGWPIFNLDWNETDFNIAYVLGQLNGYGIDSIFYIKLFHSEPDVNESSLSILVGGYYNTFSAEKVKNLIEKYNLTIDEDDSVSKELIVEEIEIFSRTLNDMFNMSYEYESNPILISEIIDEVEGFDWDTYLEALFGERFDQNSTYVNIGSVETLKKLVIFLNKTQPRVIANYFLMCTLNGVEKYVFDEIPKLWELRTITQRFAMKHNSNQMDQLIVADIQEDLDAIVEGKLKYVLSEKNYEIVKNFLNVEHQKSKEFKDFKILFSDEDFDEYFDDYDIDPNNTIQNILSALKQDYLGKIKYANESILREDQESFVDWLEQIEPIWKLPTVYYFSHYVFRIWVDVYLEIIDDIELYSNEPNCYGNDFLFFNWYAIYNEALRLTYETYNLWLERNQEIADKENTTPFTNKQLLLLIVDGHLCSNNRNRYIFNYFTRSVLHDYTDLWIEQFNCTDVIPSNKTSCSLFD